MSASDTHTDLSTIGMTGTSLRRVSKSNLPLATLTNPSKEILNNYTKSELQKRCSQLGLGSVWTTKDVLVEKLLDYYAGLHAPQLSPSTSIESIENETSPPKGLLQRFEEFVRETKDNFIVINTSLKDKDREIEELKSKLFLAEETIKELKMH